MARRVILSFFKMSITRSYCTILAELDVTLERLSDEWERVQSKKRRARSAEAQNLLKRKMNLILRVILKFQKCRGRLVKIDEEYGNSVERQRAKEEMEVRLSDMDKLFEYFRRF